MIRAVTLVVAAWSAACSPSSSPPTGDKPASTGAINTATTEHARHGAELATVPALPRAHWPAQVAWYDKNGYRSVTRFEYATDQPCTLTVAAQQEGRVGCVTRSVTLDEQGDQVVTEHAYDTERRLIDDLKTRWEDALAVGTYQRPVYRSLDRGADGPNLGLRKPDDDGFLALYRVEGERLIAHYRARDDRETASVETPDKPRTSLTWGPTRLLEIRTEQQIGYVEYADNPPPERAETTARRARETADREVAALGTFASLPRRDWPCTRTQTWSDGEVVHDTFEYDAKRTSCKLPIARVADGVVGCPNAIVSQRTLADGTRRDPERNVIEYHGDGLRARRRLDGLFAGTWNGPFIRTAHGFRLSDEGATAEYELTDGKLVKASTAYRGISDGTVLSWRGGRLDQLIREAAIGESLRGTTTFTYDCR
ncbi:MAG: hypothetical protein ACKV2T_03880 [Kofleriaceae bacterium]